ncbi:MAG TPA: hypothetical protein VIU34_21840 [Steroidobacter sp.]
MSKVTFRAKRRNTAFLVEIEMSVAAEAVNSLCDDVQRWLNDEWVPRNQLWRRVCSNAGREYIQNLLYFEEFNSAPRVLSGGSQLRLVIEARNAGNSWRDWLVARLVPDVKSRFPQIGETLLIRNFEQV